MRPRIVLNLSDTMSVMKLESKLAVNMLFQCMAKTRVVTLVWYIYTKPQFAYGPVLFCSLHIHALFFLEYLSNFVFNIILLSETRFLNLIQIVTKTCKIVSKSDIRGFADVGNHHLSRYPSQNKIKLTD